MRVCRSFRIVLCLLAVASVGPAVAHAALVPDPPVTAAQLGGPDTAFARRALSAFVATDEAGSGGVLPTSWCGQRQATDDTVDATHGPGLPQFKIVYVRPPDGPDNFQAWADIAQRSASDIELYLAGATGGRKSWRFDLGTSCGPGYLDITSVTLPRPAAYYQHVGRGAACIDADTSKVFADVDAALGRYAGRLERHQFQDNGGAGAATPRSSAQPGAL